MCTKMFIVLLNSLLCSAEGMNAKFDQGANGYFQVPSKWQPLKGKPKKDISVSGKTQKKTFCILSRIRKVNSKTYEGSFIIY